MQPLNNAMPRKLPGNQSAAGYTFEFLHLRQDIQIPNMRLVKVVHQLLQVSIANTMISCNSYKRVTTSPFFFLRDAKFHQLAHKATTTEQHQLPLNCYKAITIAHKHFLDS